MPLGVFESSKSNAKIVQFSDDAKTLPDGSKMIYAENEEKIVLYHKPAFEKASTYIYDRKSGKLLLDGKSGTNQEKRKMIQLGSYFLQNANDQDLITVDILTKGS